MANIESLSYWHLVFIWLYHASCRLYCVLSKLDHPLFLLPHYGIKNIFLQSASDFKMTCGNKFKFLSLFWVGVHPFLSPCIYLPMIRLRQLRSSCRIFVTRELMMVLSFECMVLFIILSHNAATQSKCWSNSILNVEFR